MAKKISQLPITSPVQDTDYTIVYDLETGQTKRATKADFKGDTGEIGPTGPIGLQGEPGNPGAQGENSLAWNHGYIFPVVASGVIGDYYLHASNGDVYKKASGVWNLVTNIIGPIGPQGIQGEIGPQGIQGASGLQGIQGIQGIQGEIGPQGIQGLGSNIRTFTFNVEEPASGVIYGPRLAENHTIKRIDSNVDIGYVDFGITTNNNFTAAGANLFPTQQRALASGVVSSSFNNPIVASGNWIALRLNNVFYDTNKFIITIQATT